MKLMKKLSAVLLSLCLLVPCFSMAVSAADGRISFTDPSTAVGEYFEVKCVLRSTSGDMGAVEVELEYDEDYLRFESGDGVEDNGDGTLTCAGTANTAEASFTAKFQALQEGTTKVEITGSTVADTNGASLTLDHGSSAVTIEEGDPSLIEEGGESEETEDSAAEATGVDIQADLNGVTYALTDDFADADIPSGYARTQRTIDGTEYQMVENDNGSVCLGYMTDADNNGEFFLYNEETASFSPYAEISISDVASIIVLSDASQVSLPANYQEAKLSLNEKEFPVWQNTESEGMYVIYAMNNNGETGFYQYDSVEGTYQRFEPGTAEVAEEEETDTSSVFGKVLNLVKGHLSLVLLAVAVAAVIGLIILIVLAVKLHNRNAELDELYDEYGIDEEEEEEVKPSKKELKKEAKKEAKKSRKQKVKEPEFEEEDFEEEDFEEEDFEEEDFEEEDFEEEDFEEADFEEEVFEDYRASKAPGEALEEFTGFTERMDFTIDDLDELLEEKSDKRRGHIDEDDTFKMDFIDLD